MPELLWHHVDVVQRSQKTEIHLTYTISPYSPLHHTSKRHFLLQVLIRAKVGEAPAFWENISVPRLYRLESTCPTAIEVVGPWFQQKGRGQCQYPNTQGQVSWVTGRRMGQHNVLTHRESWWWLTDTKVPKIKVNRWPTKFLLNMYNWEGKRGLV